MRIISLCVEGIREAAQHGFYDWVTQQDADVICLQDLRVWEYQLDDDKTFHPEGYERYFFDAYEEGTNGVAVYCRKAPKAVMTGLGFGMRDYEARYIQLDYETLSIASFLGPVATEDPQSQEDKIQFFDDFQAHLHKVSRKRRDFIICGNWQMAHTAADVENAQSHDDDSGFRTYERQWLEQLYTDLGYTDAFRHAIKDEDEYTWWPSGTQGEGDGWRVDTQVVSNNLRPRIEHAAIYKTQVFSSHAPVIVDYDIEV